MRELVSTLSVRRPGKHQTRSVEEMGLRDMFKKEPAQAKPEDLAWMTSVFLGMTHLTPRLGMSSNTTAWRCPNSPTALGLQDKA
ncbi:hypothetical protein AMK34_13090 [Amycolatopsis sp. CB00013]|nr:hypothetical protein AMK34_13090 [Amycolatopsis sp. CB00013]